MRVIVTRLEPVSDARSSWVSASGSFTLSPSASDGLPEARAEPEERAGDARADRQFAVVHRFAGAAELPGHAADDVLAELAVAHGVVRRSSGVRLVVVHRDDAFGVLAARHECRGSDHVTGPIEVRDAIAAERRRYDRLQDAGGDDVEVAEASRPAS
jgi:hypothetical protein